MTAMPRNMATQIKDTAIGLPNRNMNFWQAISTIAQQIADYFHQQPRCFGA
jgi:hypothetical protein